MDESDGYSWFRPTECVQLPVDASYRTDVRKMRETIFALIE